MVVTAFLIGLAGSLHCVGMCSPLAMAVSGLSPSALTGRLLYNGGRILTYGVLGAAVGAFGALAGLTEYQTLLSVALGVVLILLGVSGVSLIRIPVLSQALYRLTGWLKGQFGKLVQSKRRGALALMGAINGLLPCGLTYFALTYCVTLPNAKEGFAFMALFGLGTLPAMLGVPAFLAWVSSRWAISLRRMTAVILIVLGAFLVVRAVWVHPHGLHPAAAQASEVICP
jgi:sulfite exporter TauE/SafE